MVRIREKVMIAGLAAALLMLGGQRSALAQNPADDSGPDPALANMAPADLPDATPDAGSDTQPDAQQQPAPAGQGTNEAITAAQAASPNDQPPPGQSAQDQSAPDQNAQAPTNQTDQTDQAADLSNDQSNNVDYDDAAVQSDQPPPPLPDYEQPPLPGDGYIWTPGYWAWSPDEGYYWVPGAWVMPPYEDALWTPGWWGFHDGGYYFFAGYWGPYIGYYGGINYGFGYIGRGYEGGYWRDHRFQYNRAVNIIRIGNVPVYSHAVASPSSRYSFNGPGGARRRPAPAELKAMRQPRVAPMSTQVQMQRDAQQNRGQFANENHGRPAAIAAPQPVAADIHTQPLPPARIPQQRQQSLQGQQQRPAQQQPQNYPRPQQVPQQTFQTRPVPQQEQPEKFQREQRPEQQPQPAPHSRQTPQENSHPAPQPQVHPEPAPQSRPAPQQQQGHGDGHDDHPHQ